jgi:hypothetical protein
MMISFAQAPRTMREFQTTCVVLEKGFTSKVSAAAG